MSLVMQGTWTVSIKSKSAAYPQRVRIVGASSGTGTYVVPSTAMPVTVTGASWTIFIEADDGSAWRPSRMRFKNPVASGAFITLDIESDDAGSDGDFNDLLVTCTMQQTASDFVVYGHATAYSGHCWFNPCSRLSLVLDSAAQLDYALKNPVARAALEKLYPERILPGPRNPPDPAPMSTFTPLVLPTPRAAGIPAPVIQTTKLQGGVVSRSLQSKVSSLTVNSDSTAVATQLSAAPERSSVLKTVDSSLLAKIGQLVDGIRVQCSTTTLGNYALRFQEYDRTSLELAGGPYMGTGEREDIGTAATDAFGNYVFRFTRTGTDFNDEVLTDMAVGEDFTVQQLPDVIVQVLGAGQVPAAETACFFNIPAIRRIDICVPSTNIVLPSSCVGSDVLTFIGKISLTSNLNTLDDTGRITARSTAGNAPLIECGVWWGNLDLWGCLGKSVVRYTLGYRPLGAPASAWQFHALLERRETVGGSSTKIGPFFDTVLNVPYDGLPPVACPHYLNPENIDTIIQPGSFLKATLGSGGFATGSYEVRIDGYDAAGVAIVSETRRLFVDNTQPSIAVSDIILAGAPVNISGVGCTLQTLTPAELSANLDVRFKVDHASGAIANYRVHVTRCNQGIEWTSYLSGGQREFIWAKDDSVACDVAPNFRRGTAEDPNNDGTGFVTTTLAPNAPWLAAGENFTILRVSLSYNHRATTGYVNASTQSTGPWVWGIQQ